MTKNQLTLNYNEWEALLKSNPLQDTDDKRWLAAWNRYDLACSPMEDTQRSLLRYGHYLGWCDGTAKQTAFTSTQLLKWIKDHEGHDVINADDPSMDTRGFCCLDCDSYSPYVKSKEFFKDAALKHYHENCCPF